MSRESRLLAILLGIAVVGVSGLMVVADQYRKALVGNARPGGGESASAHALRLVDGFLAARQAAKGVVLRYPVEIRELDAGATLAYRAARLNALAAHRISYDDYAAVRAAWRAYRAGKPMRDPALFAAFESRRGALDDAALGPIESVDDAIK